MYRAKATLHILVLGCLVWASLAVDPNCIKIDITGECLETADGVQTLPASPQETPVGAPVGLSQDQYLIDDNFIKINAKLRR